ncbi:hypothetical protein HA466_0080140 [Hirschfeldia incana]|nr:hypothetical protein HA466_0080140 [Hirschfeldia incana]
MFKFNQLIEREILTKVKSIRFGKKTLIYVHRLGKWQSLTGGVWEDVEKDTSQVATNQLMSGSKFT